MTLLSSMTTTAPHPPATWILVPAAGVGSRMGTSLPKQYLSLGEQSLLETTLQRLLQVPDIVGLLLILSPEDKHWASLPLSKNARIRCVTGGRERADSVCKGLAALAGLAREDDWVMVHDAARPCVLLEDIQALRVAVAEHPVGGILGVPVSDTLKQVAQSEIQQTLDRRHIWQAQTPQVFRYGLLLQCLNQALASDKVITDEASALECFGYHPLIVQGHSDNIKVTRPEDLPLARWILQQQEATT